MSLESRYQVYVDYCRKLGVEPLEITRWYWLTDKLITPFGISENRLPLAEFVGA